MDGVHPDWRCVDRVVVREGCGSAAKYLIKWRLLPYTEATWEGARDLASPEDQVQSCFGHAAVCQAHPGHARYAQSRCSDAMLSGQCLLVLMAACIRVHASWKIAGTRACTSQALA